MLYIHVGGFELGCIKNVTGYFNLNKKKEWFNRPSVKRIIKRIDKTVAVKDEYLESPVFGGMSPEKLSCGCKAVILLEVLEGNPNVYATKCGDNCVEDILEIAKSKDITITLHHLMMFPEQFEAVIVETGRHIRSRKEFLDEWLKITREL